MSDKNKTNSATRLLEIVVNIESTPSNDTVARMWAQVFGIDVPANEEEDLLIKYTRAIRDEIDLLTAALKKRDVPISLFESRLSNLKALFSPTIFVQSAHSYRNNHNVWNEFRLTLEWACWTLRDEPETELSSEQLCNLIKHIDSLELIFNKANLPSDLLEFLRANVESLRNGLLLYKIIGARGIGKSVGDVLGAIFSNTTRIDQYKDSLSHEQKSALKKFVDVIKETGDAADAASKIYDFGSKLSIFSNHFLPFLQ